ncbi:hypothetical protein BC938DRAFT_482557 [Jimgerdemannia flammicorona]|uniref:PH domain-containing protein n=1 Tax=Jimgerdemannia flammicorona TaxID=994334 RepID=A0A433QDS3_9FUNG|nr:hypothetical protein BC938DRAFT_482557 [Jimgerdemannia flammicorona]
MQKSIAKYAVKKVLGDAQDKAVAKRTDNIELVDPAGQDKRRWWQKKKKPEFELSPKEAAVLKKVKRKANLLDKGVKICCCNIGLDPLIGLIPVIGDLIAVMFALDIVFDCMTVDLPSHIILFMFGNVAIDFFIGIIPVIGDIADFLYKCNLRNAVLLEEFLITRRRDQILMERGDLPSDHVAGTGPVPGTDVPPSAHSGPARVTVEDDEEPSGVTEIEDEELGGGPSSSAGGGPARVEEAKVQGKK